MLEKTSNGDNKYMLNSRGKNKKCTLTTSKILQIPELQHLVAFYHIVEQDVEHLPMEPPLPWLVVAPQPRKNINSSNMSTTCLLEDKGNQKHAQVLINRETDINLNPSR